MNSKAYSHDRLPLLGASLRSCGSGALLFFGFACGSVLLALPLAENSPFIPPNTPAPAPVAPSGPSPEVQNLAFRGVYSLAGVRYFNIFDKRQNKGVWVKEGDPSAQYEVTGFDESSMNVKLKLGGREQDLALDKPAWVSMPVQFTPPTVSTLPGQINPGAGGGNTPPPRPPPPPRRRIVRPNVQGAPGSPQANAPANVPQLPEELRNFTPPPPPTNIPPFPAELQNSVPQFQQQQQNSISNQNPRLPSGAPPNFTPGAPPNVTVPNR